MKIKERMSNWARLRTILSVLAKHGFSSLIVESGFHIPGLRKQENIDPSAIPKHLRMAFEELGPTFIKLGQLFSMRPDVFNEIWLDEFSKLTDQIPAISFKEVLKLLTDEYGRDPYEIFEWIDEAPRAAASISQVHLARLKDTTENVIVKIQRPKIRTMIENDIQVLYLLARSLERMRNEFKLLNLTAIVKEFQRSVNEELDFTLEARNLDFFNQTFSNLEAIRLPKVIWDFTTKKVITMTFVEGTAMSQIKVIPENVDRQYLTEALASFFFESMFFHGTFHADAHAGNILIETEGRGRLGIVDFGMVGTIGPQLRERLSKLFLYFVAKDFDNLAVLYQEVGDFKQKISLRDFQTDLRHLLSPHLGRPLKEIPIGQLMLESTKIAQKYQIMLPRDMVMVARSLMTLEYIGRKLDPDFDFMSYGQRFAQTMVKRRLSADEIAKDLFKFLEGIRSLGTDLPTQLKSLVRRLDSDEFLSQPANLSKRLGEIQRSQRDLLLWGFSSSVLFAAVFLTALKPDHPASWPLWALSFLGLTITVVRMIFK